MKRGDFVAGAVGVTISGGALYVASDFPADFVMKIGPAFFPNMLAGLLLVCCAVLMVSSVLAQPSAARPPEDPASARGLSLDNGVLRAVLTVAAVVGFTLALRPVGFILTSVVFLAAMMALLGMRKPWLMLAVAAGVTGGVYVVFEKLLGLSLPSGVLDSLLY